VAETVSLGILSLPSVLATVGLVPGIILLCVISALATYSGLLLAEFRKQYPFVQNFGDAVGLLGRSIGSKQLLDKILTPSSRNTSPLWHMLQRTCHAAGSKAGNDHIVAIFSPN
jgi:hypothetical protein